MGRVRPWLLAWGTILLLAAAACAGETFVEYRGTVSSGPVAGHSFDADPAPSADPTLAGAEVSLVVCSGACRGGEPARRAAVDASGRWGPVDLTFGGGLSEHVILVTVAAPGHVPYVYEAVYEATGDPTAGERWLNIVLTPE